MSTSARLLKFLQENGPADYVQMWRALQVQPATLDKAINTLRDSGQVREVESDNGLSIALEVIDD